jgi:hypothetical protein
MVGLLAFCAVHFQTAGRLLVTLPTDTFFSETLSLITEARYVPLRISLIWLILGALFAAVGYLMSASLWGGITTAQGGALGIFIFGLVTSAGSGWNAAVTNASDARELWHIHPTSSEVFLLRQTLFDFAKRETGAFPDIPVTVVLDRDAGITDDGVLAWLLRDFSNTRYVLSDAEARMNELVLMKAPTSEGAVPNLGGAYVGQSFTLEYRWDANTARFIDFPGWWSHGHVRVPPHPLLTVVLWVRQDIYDGVSLSTIPAG